MFSIVIPVYRLGYLEEAVRSVLAQEPTRLLDEVLLVTDGLSQSDLGLSAVVTDDARVRVVAATAGARSTGATKWNVGIDAAAAPWVVLFADDDVMRPSALAAMAEAHQRDPKCGVLRLRQWQIDGAGAVIQIGPKHPDHEDWWDHWLSRFFYGRPACLQEYAFRTDVARAVGGVPDRPLGWWTDDVFVLRAAAEAGGIASGYGAIVNWRYDGHNTSATADQRGRAAEARASIDDLELVLAAHGHEVPFHLDFLRESLNARLERTGLALSTEPLPLPSPKRRLKRKAGA